MTMVEVLMPVAVTRVNESAPALAFPAWGILCVAQ